jgi:serine-type D-Ala-D-Ala carboxypeptidase (penicillin-binding protein 5/6)
VSTPNPSPFLPPPRRPRSRRRRQGRRAWRSGVRLVLGVAIPLVLFAAISYAATRLLSGSSHAPGSATATARAGRHGSQAARGGSAAGLSSARTDSTPPAPALPALLSFHRPPRAGLLFDLDTGRVLWARNDSAVLPIASLTKMMTALLVVRAQHADTPVLVTHNAVNTAGSKVGVLPAGKRVRLETLLYGLLLPSGNDAAVALAESVAGTVPGFVARMNGEARRLRLGCTHYDSPDGLANGDRSCADDLATLARLDLAQPRIAAVAATSSTVQPLPIKGGRVWLYNNNPLLRFHYPGAIGLKTGETEAAGRCLVGIARRGDVRLGVVLLDSPELGRQAEALLDAGFHDVYHLPYVPAPPVPRGM